MNTAAASAKTPPDEGAPATQTASFAGTWAAAGVTGGGAVTSAEPAPVTGPVQPTRPIRPGRSRWPKPWHLLPGPLATPFTFGYTLLLVATSLFAEHADPELVDRLLQASSTDVEHLAQAPLLVLVASALWIAGGPTSAYAVAFLIVLTALERRAGALRTAAVFFGGHVIATLATELPVGAAVALGHLPVGALHRLDYGISFGVMACTGALAGLLPGWARWPLLAGVTWFAVSNLLLSVDPLSDSGHLLALVLGTCARPLLRRPRRPRPTAIVSGRC
ncbi:rhomboid-like protein [Streptomyces monomycini]|uniref:rhomboid-like protein n=1 Tax=Streptomyces monomycini TaxID=371720 RepID=UPI000B293383|nr:rhomboid-like protein [Streptomyces monomycini]